MNQSLSTRNFPKIFKNVTVTSIYKSGNKLDPINNRPITVTNEFSKILEKIIKSRILHLFNNHTASTTIRLPKKS